MEAITSYAVGILLILVVTLGFTSYVLYESRAALQVEVIDVKSKLLNSETLLIKSSASCEVAQTVTTEVNTEIRSKQEVLTKNLEQLSTLPSTKPAEKNDGKSYSDGGTLSPDLMQLLDQSFCNAIKTDSSCTPSGTTGPVQTGKVKK